MPALFPLPPPFLVAAQCGFWLANVDVYREKGATDAAIALCGVIRYMVRILRDTGVVVDASFDEALLAAEARLGPDVQVLEASKAVVASFLLEGFSA